MPPSRRNAAPCLENRNQVDKPAKTHRNRQSRSERRRAAEGRKRAAYLRFLQWRSSRRSTVERTRIDLELDDAELETAFGLELDGRDAPYTFRSSRGQVTTTTVNAEVNGLGRRAEALLSCGMSAVAKSPTTNNLLRAPNGGPATRRFSCNDRFCDDCTRRRNAVLVADLTLEIDRLRPDSSTWWDGRLRMLTLTRWDPKHSNFAEEQRALWRAWARLRKMFPQLETCFAAMEQTYNKERDSAHPHLHVIVLCAGKLDRTELLGAWQQINGYQVDFGRRKGSQGGVDVRQKRDIKEAVKYALKGMVDTLSEMTPSRAVECMNAIDGKRLVRTYGKLYRRSEEHSEDDDRDVDDMLLVDEETGETWATTAAVARAAGCKVAAWTHHPVALEGAREWLYLERERQKGRPPSPAARERSERATLRRRRRRRDTLERAKCRALLRLTETSRPTKMSSPTLLSAGSTINNGANNA